MNKVNVGKKAKLITGCVVGALLLTLLLVILGPFYSFWALHKAIVEKDIEALDQYINFPLLQDNASRRIRQKTMSTLGLNELNEDNILYQFANTMSEPIINMSVSYILSPTGLAMVLDGGQVDDLLQSGLSKKTLESDKHEADFNALLTKSEFTFVDAETFRVRIKFGENTYNEQTEHQYTDLFLHRSFLIWRLSDISFGE